MCKSNDMNELRLVVGASKAAAYPDSANTTAFEAGEAPTNNASEVFIGDRMKERRHLEEDSTNIEWFYSLCIMTKIMH